MPDTAISIEQEKPMFTLAIGSKPVAITDAEEVQARDIFESDEFKQDLTVMTSEGTPLWDGRTPLTFGRRHRRKLLRSRPLTSTWTMMTRRRRTVMGCS
jgi:hypothetical protein